MAQHFLLSAKARTLSLARVMRMTDEEAMETFKAIRWASNGGEPFCSRCGCTKVYDCKAEKLWKCSGCSYRFSVTSGTIFASRKLPLRDILAAIAIFMNAAKGHSALQLSRDLDVKYQTAFVLSHKIREALCAQGKGLTLDGVVEVDGMYCGGSVKQENYKKDRKDRRLAMNQSGKRQVVVAIRQRGGNTVTGVFKSEAEAVSAIRSRVAEGSVIHADEAPAWDSLHVRYRMKRINHKEAYSHAGACTNQAESFFSRLRKAEIGTHHHISGPYLAMYAGEMAWRENHRRVSNGEQYMLAVGAVMAHGVSRVWKGYNQRAVG